MSRPVSGIGRWGGRSGQGAERRGDSPEVGERGGGAYPLSMTRAATSSIKRNTSQHESRGDLRDAQNGLFRSDDAATRYDATYPPWLWITVCVWESCPETGLAAKNQGRERRKDEEL
jgi:hypothetical protein